MTEVPGVTIVTRTNRAGTVTVSATDQGLPVDVSIAKSELRYGAQPLADEILRLCRAATVEAGARRRDQLAQHGVPVNILDRLGLPTRSQAADLEEELEEQETGPSSWLRPV